MEGHYRTCWIVYQAKSMDCQYAITNITNMVQYPFEFIERISMIYLMNQMVFSKKPKKNQAFDLAIGINGITYERRTDQLDAL